MALAGEGRDRVAGPVDRLADAIGLRAEEIDLPAIVRVAILGHVDLGGHRASAVILDALQAEHDERAGVQFLPEFLLQGDFGGIVIAEHGELLGLVRWQNDQGGGRVPFSAGA